jgi:hypothetical protein
MAVALDIETDLSVLTIQIDKPVCLYHISLSVESPRP